MWASQTELCLFNKEDSGVGPRRKAAFKGSCSVGETGCQRRPGKCLLLQPSAHWQVEGTLEILLGLEILLPCFPKQTSGFVKQTNSEGNMTIFGAADKFVIKSDSLSHLFFSSSFLKTPRKRWQCVFPCLSLAKGTGQLPGKGMAASRRRKRKRFLEHDNKATSAKN